MYRNIKAEIARNNLTLSDVAEALGVNRKTLTKWIDGGVIPAPALIKMSDYFKVTIDYLLGRSERIESVQYEQQLKNPTKSGTANY